MLTHMSTWKVTYAIRTPPYKSAMIAVESIIFAAKDFDAAVKYVRSMKEHIKVTGCECVGGVEILQGAE